MIVRTTMFLLLFLAGSLVAQQSQPKQSEQKPAVPTVDGDVGECSLKVTVLDGQGHGVERAQVELNAKYGGLFGRHELDLEGYTNKDGKLLFTGLPEKTDGVAFVTATSGTLKGVAVYDPQNACENEHTLILAPAPPGQRNAPEGNF